MTEETKPMKVETRLCTYDIRNPDGAITWATEEEIKEEQLFIKSHERCSCDNCFYGRTPLAELILELQKHIKESTHE
jgi:hypothetical protein